MKKILQCLSLIFISGIVSTLPAQTFPCDNGDRLYFIQETGAQYGSLSYITNYTMGTPSVTVMFPFTTQQHNALAANPIDHYLYYKDWAMLGTSYLKRLTSTGVSTTICTLGSNSLFGCFDHIGRFWTVENNALVAYDINTCSLVKGPYSLTPSCGFLDIAFNPKDCHFYMCDLRIDTNGVVDPGYPGTQFFPAGTYGGAAFGSDGKLYGTAGTASNGDLSAINLTTNTSSLVGNFSPGPVSGKSDMASFFCSDIQAYFSDSLTGCSSQLVFFHDSSTGAVGNWNWNFGDPASGTSDTSTLQNPSHQFSGPGTYTVTLVVSTGANICYSNAIDSAFLVITISASAGPALTPAQTQVSCNNSCDGTASISASGGTVPYSYIWSNGQSSSSITGLCAGTFSVVVTDSAGCSSSSIFNITQPAALTATANASQASCGSTTGTATVTVSGGSGSYTYSWSPAGGSSTVATGLSIGSYTCLITDSSGCTIAAVASVVNSGAPFVTLSGQANVLCFGGSTGSAAVSASGGTPGYTYSWSPAGGTSSAATGLSAGNYVVTVTDGVGCSNVLPVTITEPGLLSSTVSSSPSGCTSPTGSATITASGGTAPFSYVWSPSVSSSSSASALTAGSYSVTVVDTNGCTSISSFSVATVSSPTATVAGLVNILCNGLNTGSAAVSVSGGSLPYTYSWSPAGGSGALAVGLAAGNYSVLITDASGCTATQSITISAPPAINTSVVSQPSACNDSTGTASVSAAGGTGALSYFWNPGLQTNASVSGLAPGTYTVVISDANGCASTETITITAAGGPSVTVSPNITIAAGTSTTLNASGGGTYQWSTGETNATIVVSPSVATIYIVLVTDSNGCNASDTVFVYVEPIDPCASWTGFQTVILPSAFSPNGDQENDELCLQGAVDCVAGFSIQIFNRWGEIVFSTTDKTFCWDGLVKGKQANSAVYVYYLEATLTSGEEIQRKGNVSLLR